MEPKGTKPYFSAKISPTCGSFGSALIGVLLGVDCYNVCSPFKDIFGATAHDFIGWAQCQKIASASSARELDDGGFGAAAGSSVPFIASIILLPLSSQQWAEAASFLHGVDSRDSTSVPSLPCSCLRYADWATGGRAQASGSCGAGGTRAGAARGGPGDSEVWQEAPQSIPIPPRR